MTHLERKSYNLDEVAQMTGLSKRSLAGGCRTGRVPAHKWGGRWFMTVAEFDQFLEQTKFEPPHAAEVTEFEAARQRVAARLARRHGRAAA